MNSDGNRTLRITKMKIELFSIGQNKAQKENKYDVRLHIKKRYEPLTLDQIEDLEMNLTDIIKQLQDYRIAQICETKDD